MLEVMERILRDEEQGAEFLISFWIDRLGHGQRGLSIDYDAAVGLRETYGDILRNLFSYEERVRESFDGWLHDRYPQLQDLLKDLFERGFIEQAMHAKGFFNHET